jgi:hypothetical protein
VPYTDTCHDGDGSYYDFRQHPELIPSVLEDFRPFSGEPAIQRFYDMLRWVNGPKSALESTDCVLRAPGRNETAHLGGGASLQMMGRLMIIYRNKRLNTLPPDIKRLSDMLEQSLKVIDDGWLMGAIGYAFYRAHFTSLGDEPAPETIGRELCLRFWAWGNSDAECFANLERIFANLLVSLEQTSAAIVHPQTS